MKPKIDYSLYLLADPQHCKSGNLITTVQATIAAGVTCVQLRAKSLPIKKIIELGENLLQILHPLKIPLIINDHLAIAHHLNADGIHLGQADIPYYQARKLLGPDKIIGLSIENYQQALHYSKADVDYFGVGPIFATRSKIDTSSPIGISELRKISKILKKPMIAIGGINQTNIKQVMECNIAGVAVISAILASDNPSLTAQQLSQIIKVSKK